MNYRAVCFELLAERSALKAKNKMLLASLEDMIDACEHWEDQDDPVLIAAREAIDKAKGGE